MLHKIYIATNKINGKIYIGKTSESMDRRISKHVATSRRSNAKFPNAIKKYGIKAFDFDVVEEVDSTMVNQKEMMYIAYFNSQDIRIGYNTTKGGEGISGHVFTTEQRKRMSDAHKKPVPQRRKTLYVYKDGVLIDTFIGQEDCANKYCVKKTSITNNLSGLSKFVSSNIGKLQFKYNLIINN